MRQIREAASLVWESIPAALKSAGRVALLLLLLLLCVWFRER